MKQRNEWFYVQPDEIEQERSAQSEEFLKRQGKDTRNPAKVAFSKASGAGKKTMAMDFKEQLYLTSRWLAETFPHLFAPDNTPAIDHNLLRELKNHYKRYQQEKKYPDNLVIKGALNLYTSSRAYLYVLREGAIRYALDGTQAGTVTKGEAEEGRRKLDDI